MREAEQLLGEAADGVPLSRRMRLQRAVFAMRSEVTLFKYLTPVECQVIYTLTTPRSFRDGEAILVEGEPGTGLHILETGKVALLKRCRDGRRQVLGYRMPFAHFGEMSMLNAEPASCTVTAVGDVDTLVMTKTQFTNLLHRSESLGVRVLRALCEELSNRARETVNAQFEGEASGSASDC